MRALRMISGNLIFVAALVLVVSHILDWYNPFMDFSGHTFFMIYVMAGAIMAFVASNIKIYRDLRKRKPQKLSMQ